MIDRKTVVRGIHLQVWIAIAKVHVRNAKLLGEGLQLAVPVRDADRADVVALREQQFENVAAVALEPLPLWPGARSPMVTAA